MSEGAKDRWAEWLLHRRDADDPEQRERALGFLGPIRDRVLENAALSEGETLLDVGAGNGLIAFGALDRVGERGRVVFSDVSRDLLDHSRALAEELGALDRCRFVRAPANDLGLLGDASVDAVTTRSVLIYVEDKRRAFGEFHRVLKPGGRLSIFEPINRFDSPNHPVDGHLLAGYDTRPVRDLARRVWAVYEGRQPRDTDPMLDFDERDLLEHAESVGFEEIRLDYEAKVAPNAYAAAAGWGWSPSWEVALKSSGNPEAPTLEEAIAEALTAEEAERFVAHLRPAVEKNEKTARHAVAYLRAVKARQSVVHQRR
jgi:arsenite methyltransferase